MGGRSWPRSNDIRKRGIPKMKGCGGRSSPLVSDVKSASGVPETKSTSPGWFFHAPEQFEKLEIEVLFRRSAAG
jgi:hypothetical protein